MLLPLKAVVHPPSSLAAVCSIGSSTVVSIDYTTVVTASCRHTHPTASSHCTSCLLQAASSRCTSCISIAASSHCTPCLLSAASSHHTACLLPAACCQLPPATAPLACCQLAASSQCTSRLLPAASTSCITAAECCTELQQQHQCLSPLLSPPASNPSPSPLLLAPYTGEQQETHFALEGDTPPDVIIPTTPSWPLACMNLVNMPAPSPSVIMSFSAPSIAWLFLLSSATF